MKYDNLGPYVEHIDKPDSRAITDEFGDTYYYNNNISLGYRQLHRDSGPAVELLCGYRAWYRYGKKHREGGPAVVYLGEEWYLNGLRHRIDGPAIIENGGDKEWWVNGKRHRENGPALEFSNGDFYYYINDFLHREDGPAVKWEGKFEYWIGGVQLTHKEFLEKQNNEKA